MTSASVQSLERLPSRTSSISALRRKGVKAIASVRECLMMRKRRYVMNKVVSRDSWLPTEPFALA